MYKKYRLGSTRAIYVPVVLAEDITKLTRRLDRYGNEERVREIIDLMMYMLDTLGPSINLKS